MGRPLGHVRILLSSRVLLDLEEADRIFAEKGAAVYTDYMCGRGEYAKDYVEELGGRRLNPGPLWNFVQAALRLNEQVPGTVEITLLCKDSAETALPIFRNLDVANVFVEGRMLTAGGPLTEKHLRMFDFDMFLTRNVADAQLAVDMGIAAAAMEFPAQAVYQRQQDQQIHLCFDGDAVTFDTESELFYKEKWLEEYRIAEFNHFAKRLGPGPFTNVLAKISQLNKKFPRGQEPFVLSFLTARGHIAGARALTTVQGLGVEFNGGMFFVSGADKADVLKSMQPDIFFDDQRVHLEKTSLFCPAAWVPYRTGSPMSKWMAEHGSKKNQPPSGPQSK